MELIRRLLNLLLSNRFEVTEHALESMDDDELTMKDVTMCLASGKLRRSWPRERKYEIEGRSVDRRPMRIVCRITSSDVLRFITVYEKKKTT